MIEETPNVGPDVLDRIYRTILDRHDSNPKVSYTAKLFSRGRGKIVQKIGEEAVEVVVEGMRNDISGIVSESSDLLFHLLILWADAGIEPSQVWKTLSEREGQGGLNEKRARHGP